MDRRKHDDDRALLKVLFAGSHVRSDNAVSGQWWSRRDGSWILPPTCSRWVHVLLAEMPGCAPPWAVTYHCESVLGAHRGPSDAAFSKLELWTG